MPINVEIDLHEWIPDKTNQNKTSEEATFLKEELTDVAAWNQKHGVMWVIYGIIIILYYFVGMIVGDSVWCVTPMCGGVMVPIIFMIRYHNKLSKEYMR